MEFRDTTVKIDHVVRLNGNDNETFDSERLQYTLYKAIKELNNGPMIVDYSNIKIQTKSRNSMVAFRLEAPAMVLLNPEDIIEGED